MPCTSSRPDARRWVPTLLLEYRDFEVEDRLQATGGQALRIRGSRATYDGCSANVR